MADRHAAYIVTLSEDHHADDSQAVMDAIRMIRGVADVQPVTASVEIRVASARANEQWVARLLDLIREMRARHDGH